MEVVGTINIVFGDLIRWLEGEDIEDVVSDFMPCTEQSTALT
jgi:hypothetical protein